MRDPFKPSAGSKPPEVIGRAGVLDEFEQSLQHASVAPGLTVITGARGIGKTVMLTVAEDLARGHDWGVISESATRGVAGRLREWVHLQDEKSFRGIGLVITVDEVHAVDRPELAQIAAGLEHLASEGRRVALVAAGLSAPVGELSAGESAAFLLPADRIVLRNVAISDVEESFAKTFTAGGFEVSPGILH